MKISDGQINQKQFPEAKKQLEEERKQLQKKTCIGRIAQRRERNSDEKEYSDGEDVEVFGL